MPVNSTVKKARLECLRDFARRAQNAREHAEHMVEILHDDIRSWHGDFTLDEIHEATGLPYSEIAIIVNADSP